MYQLLRQNEVAVGEEGQVSLRTRRCAAFGCAIRTIVGGTASAATATRVLDGCQNRLKLGTFAVAPVGDADADR